MKTKITVSGTISKINNDYSFRLNQKYTPQWQIHNR
jgi:hypothetical protein